MSQLWKFQPNRYWYGWDETGLSIFGGQPIRSLVRELIQNSLDAKADDSDKVKVEFELFTVQREMLPGADTLTEILAKCLEASASESEDSRANVNEAYEYSKRRNFSILSCTDSGTKGMSGPYERGKDFFTYMNSKGSSPGDSSRAGSHGHGKDAPLVNSAMRTIFASTTYKTDTGSLEHLAQGKCVFMSHFQDEDQYENIGQWGTHNIKPVSDLNAEYSWINRRPHELGTTISIVGFTGKGSDWMSEMIGHILINYFPALMKDTLEVELRDGGKTIIVNSANFIDFFESNSVQDALKKVDQDLVDELHRTIYFVSAMMESRGGKLRDQQASAPLGLVHFNILVNDNAPRAYCLVRRDMKICEKVPNLQRISTKYSNFAMVIECQTSEANSLIRSMEPSEHDRVEIGRLKEGKRAEGEKLWRLLRDKFANVMDQEALPEQRISGQVDFLAKFFPDLANEESGVSFEDDEGLDGDRIKLRPIESRNKKRRISFTEFDEENNEPPERKRDSQHDDGNEIREENTDTESLKEEKLKLRRLQQEVRNQRVVELGKNAAKLIVRLEKPEDCYISLAEVGLDLADFLQITSASQGELVKGKVFIPKALFDQESTIRLQVSFDRDVTGGYLAVVEKSLP